MFERLQLARGSRRLVAVPALGVCLVWTVVTTGCASGELENDASDAGEPEVVDPGVDADTGPIPDADSAGDIGDVVPETGPDSDDVAGDVDAGPCEGRCGDGELCRSGTCVDPCREEGAVCGTVEDGGRTFDCGSCASGQFCDGSNACEQICRAAGAECGDLFWGGETTNCGTCSGTATCFHNRCVDSGRRDITTGEKHTCVTDSGGAVSCWGSDLSAQLGNGSDGASKTAVSAPVGGTGVEVAGQRFHTCARMSAGDVECWGANNKGQVGNGGTAQTIDRPDGVVQLSTAVSISVGDEHSCAVLNGGRVRCWGAETSGRLGNGNSSLQVQPTPVPVKNISDAVEVAAGGSHTCALREDGTVDCWGRGSGGRLGNGGVRESAKPVSVTGLEGVVDIGAGAEHTCAVTQEGTVWCWGVGGSYQLGQGSSTNELVPVKVQKVGRAVAVAAGTSHTCARTVSGTVYCWGDNVEKDGQGTIVAGGQIGDGSFDDAKKPVQVVGPGGGGALRSAVALAAGRRHTCAVTDSGVAYCWGTNTDGQLGDGTTKHRNVPVKVK